jgi:hypothetical protein
MDRDRGKEAASKEAWCAAPERSATTEELVMHSTARAQKKIATTVGELAAAYYEAALAELGEKTLAARVAQQMVQVALRRRGA